MTQMGIKTGHEYIAVVDNRTGEIVRAGTNGLQRRLGFDDTNGADEPGAYTIRHNHPGSTAVSVEDILLTRTAPGISNVVAHGHDGSMTRVSAGTKMPGEDAMRRLHDRAEVEAVVMLQWLVDKGRLDAHVGDHFIGDVTNRLLQADGIIDYVSSQPIPASIRTAPRKKLRNSGYGSKVVDNAAVSVRPEERTVGLPQGVRAGQGPSGRESGDSEGSGVS